MAIPWRLEAPPQERQVFAYFLDNHRGAEGCIANLDGARSVLDNRPRLRNAARSQE